MVRDVDGEEIVGTASSTVSHFFDEKYRLPNGETTLYVQDESGGLHRLRFQVEAGNPREITVAVARRAI